MSKRIFEEFLKANLARWVHIAVAVAFADIVGVKREMLLRRLVARDNIGDEVGVFVGDFALGAVGAEVIYGNASGDTPPTMQAKRAI